MRLPHSLALLRRPRRAGVRSTAVRVASPVVQLQIAPAVREASVPATVWTEPPYIDLAQRVREVGEW